MRKLICISAIFIGIMFQSLTSIGAMEEWEIIKQQGISKIYKASAKADLEDEKLFSELFGKKNESSEQAVNFILYNYPPKKGGVYLQLKEHISSLLKREIVFWGSGTEWSSPWSRIAVAAAGASDPFILLQNLVALGEIRRIPEAAIMSRKIIAIINKSF